MNGLFVETQPGWNPPVINTIISSYSKWKPAQKGQHYIIPPGKTLKHKEHSWLQNKCFHSLQAPPTHDNPTPYLLNLTFSWRISLFTCYLYLVWDLLKITITLSSFFFPLLKHNMLIQVIKISDLVLMLKQCLLNNHHSSTNRFKVESLLINATQTHLHTFSQKKKCYIPLSRAIVSPSLTSQSTPPQDPTVTWC